MTIESRAGGGAILAEIGRRLARVRVARNLTQDELAARAGVGRAGAHSYEQTVEVVRRLGMGTGVVEQRAGRWTLAPAFDVTYAYAPPAPGPAGARCR